MQASCLKGDILKRTLAVSLYAGTSPLLAFFFILFSKRTQTRGFVTFATLFSCKLCQLPAVFTLFFQESLEVLAHIRHHPFQQGKKSLSGCPVGLLTEF